MQTYSHSFQISLYVPNLQIKNAEINPHFNVYCVVKHLVTVH
jgi:hypothetical protein